MKAGGENSGNGGVGAGIGVGLVPVDGGDKTSPAWRW